MENSEFRIPNSELSPLHCQPMRILALDFDGVLCNSAREVFVVGADTFAIQEPSSPILPKLRRLRDDALCGGSGYLNDPIYERFADLLPLGNRAEDFGVSLKAIETATPLEDQDAYDEFYRDLGPKWLDAYHRRFYECRNALRGKDREAWLHLHLPYPGVGDMLLRHRATTAPAVATAKDTESVELLLEELGMSGVFDSELVLDKETGVNKTHHLRALADRTGVPFENITFVDDKVNHLGAVAELGVRGVLAAWGFNSGREHALAASLGFPVANLGNAEEILFKGE